LLESDCRSRAVESIFCGGQPYVFDGIQKENLLNVVDLGRGRTGIAVYIQGADSRGIQLREYKDGADLKHMPSIQSVGVAE
jgi:hypothetical protein